MKEILIVTSGLFGSVITFIIQAIVNARINSINHTRKIEILVFQRKTEVVEQAISWYQEAIDTYMMFQMALRTYDKNCNPITMEKIHMSSLRSLKLYNESSTRLNPIYLYYDFKDIYEEFHGKFVQQKQAKRKA